MDEKAAQRERLRKTVESAHKIRKTLQGLLEEHGHKVHFRPSSTGVAMVGLLHERPQRGKSGISLTRVVEDFDQLFRAFCQPTDQGRRTREKELQSFLIRESYPHARRLEPINIASKQTNEPVELVFVTDEIALPVDGGKVVCDILALRRDGGRRTPVLLELKDDRMLARLIEQVERYAALVDEHAELFAELYGALLGETIEFDAPTEKWIVWPAVGAGSDPRAAELATKGIRVVSYGERDGRYTFRVGPGVGATMSHPE